jgi:site-specific recombinase XerD
MSQAFEPANKGRTFPAEILTPEEVGMLFRACSNKAPTGIRNRALLTILYRSGLRVSEALDLSLKDIDRQACTVRVLHGKGDRARVTGIDPHSFAAIDRWIDKRKELGLARRSRLFCTLEGKPIDTSYVRHLMKRLATKAGIDKRVHAHGLRHTLAAELAAERKPMNVIQAQLGHGSLATTSRYLAHIRPQQLIDEMQQREPWDPGTEQ